MKRKGLISAILLIALLFSFVACSGNGDRSDTDPSSPEISIPDRVLLSKTSIDSSGNEYRKEVYEYNEYGSVKCLTIYHNGGKINTTEYTYDSRNRCLSKTVTDYNFNYDTVENYSYIYEENGNYVCQGPDTVLSYTVDSVTGSYVVKETHHDSEYFLIWENSFDPITKKITNETYYTINSYDEVSYSIDYKYDEYGELCETIKTLKSGDVNKTVYLNQYDGGRLIHQAVYENDAPRHSLSFEYNDMGELAKETVTLASGILAYETVYEYGDFNK